MKITIKTGATTIEMEGELKLSKMKELLSAIPAPRYYAVTGMNGTINCHPNADVVYQERGDGKAGALEEIARIINKMELPR